ncbi:MAG: ATP-binding protein [Gammaproteobacteria bacterium]|nr:ATP-binding protein [Gammaproteobacteria bacterium]MCY4219436.1 ATP-binding protein [Gammaproteobacteria bacterium]MCY4274070.1 ATP-binding protein [Gammaproteobacteria bacterium]
MNRILDRKKELLTLYTPGDGGEVPPFLAGRGSEKQFFQLAIYTLVKKHQGYQNMILFGPRGNGKTSLLHSLADEANKEYGDNIEVLWVTPSEITTPEKFDHWIRSEGRRATPVVQEVRGKIKAWFAEGTASFSIQRSDGIKTAIKERCEAKPLVLIVDEAHRLDEKTAEDLLNASQSVRRENIPFFLVLSGTPGLTRSLAQAEASFWERGEIFPLGRLSLPESVEALVKPLEPFDILFAGGVAKEVAIKSHSYPFFIQLWGKCLMEELVNTEKTIVDAKTVLDAERRVNSRIHQMYAKRFSELDDRGLLNVAAEIAEAFLSNNNMPIPILEMNELVGDRKDVELLEQLGYIWRVLRDEAKQLGYEPGIPSLMGFVLEQIRGFSEPETTISRDE